MSGEHILLIHLFTTFALFGLIWTIQLVHYPFFQQIEPEQFKEILLKHGKRITPLVAPLMVIELGTAIYLVIYAVSHFNYHLAGLVLVIMIWLSTFFIQVPLHSALIQKHNREKIRRLIGTNWIRTILWSVKSVIGLMMLFEILGYS